MAKILQQLILITVLGSSAQAAVLIEDTKASTNNTSVQSVSAEKFESFNDVYALNAKKRVAVGSSFLGWSGFISANLDVHYLDDNFARFVIGGGPGYQSFGIGWRWIAMETDVHPIIGFGFTNWFGQLTAQKDPSPPNFFSNEVINSSDRSAGRFSHFFHVPAVGVEWTQLSGPGVGASVYLEINLLIHASTLNQYTTANLGASYAF